MDSKNKKYGRTVEQVDMHRKIQWMHFEKPLR